MNTFKFWRENSVSKEYSLKADQLKEKYKAFLKGRPVIWVHHYYDLTISEFIAARDGLNSVSDPKDLCKIRECLSPVLRQFIKSTKQQVK